MGLIVFKNYAYYDKNYCKCYDIFRRVKNRSYIISGTYLLKVLTNLL